MSSVRELLESAAPAQQRAPLPAAEVRRRGDRRRRRGYAGGAVVAVAGVGLAAFVGVQVLDSSGRHDQPVGRPTTSAPSTPLPSLQPVRDIEETRWIPDLQMLGITTTQAYPDEKGNRPRALLTFASGGVLVLDVMMPGEPAVTVRGSYLVTTDAKVSAAISPALRAQIALDLTAPDGASAEVTALVARLELVTTAEGYLPADAPPSLDRMTLFLYGPTHTTVYGELDLVRGDAVLPSPYPQRP